MELLLHPSKLQGTVQIPASKSILHRAFICAALAEGTSVIRNVYFSQDIEATMNCLRRLGASFKIDGNTVTVHGIQHLPDSADLDCGESGSTIRFLIPLAAALGIDTDFHGHGRLVTRPLDLYKEILENHDCYFDYCGSLPCKVHGKLTGGNFTVAGNISSQFITGLLFALPLAESDSFLKVIPPFESKSYVQITCSVLKQFGIQIIPLSDGLSYRIPGNQHYCASDYLAESDCSQAAFFLTANALGQHLSVRSFADHSVQGDFAIFDLVRQSGLIPAFHQGTVTTSLQGRHPLNIDASDIPDLVPALAVLATSLNGTTKIDHVARLTLKESDRIQTTLDLICSLGGHAEYQKENDLLLIEGNTKLIGGTVDSANDHRIAMAAAIAASACQKEVYLQRAEAVRKSFPTFWKVYQQIGGKFDVISME